MELHRIALVVAGLLALSGQLSATLYRVGPGRTYTSLQAVTSSLNPGDTVDVDGNFSYAGGVVLSRSGAPSSPIVIRGIIIAGQKPILSGGTNTLHIHADNYVIENLEITGGASRCIFHQGDNIVIRGAVIRDCSAQGLLGADRGSGSLTLEFSEIYNCGNGTQNHPVYMATDEVDFPGSVFRMQFCYLHDGTGGNLVKTRAERNEIYYNWLEGGLYRELELIGPDPAGGVPSWIRREHSDVVGNLFWKTSTATTVRVGGDGTGDSGGRYRFVNNTFVLAPGSAGVIQTFDSLESIELHNNVFYRRGGGSVQVITNQGAIWTSGAPVIAGQNNWVPSGSTIPAQWTGTLTGNDPGFADLNAFNLRPTPASPLLNQGTEAPLPSPGFDFPAPLFPPTYHPPQRTITSGKAELRSSNGVIDIGAYEAEGPTGVPDPELPPGQALLRSHPNPFNPSTTIEFRIPKPGIVSMRIYDSLGREVARLFEGETSAGMHEIPWNAGSLASGVYVCRLTAGELAATMRVVLTH